MDFKGFICILVLYISTTNGAAIPEPEENYDYHFNQLAVVGHRTIQTGVQQVVTGHTHAVAGQDTIPQSAHSFARAPQNIDETRPIASPAIPAPADTIVQQKIAAPFRTHPRITNIVPQINIQNYDVDVPIPVPHAVLVPAPYKDHAVQEIVESPHIHHATVETHSSQPVVTTHATLVHAGEVEDNKEAL